MEEERGNQEDKLGRRRSGRSKGELEFWKEWSGAARDIIRQRRAFRLSD
jgi:hypothetical protein